MNKWDEMREAYREAERQIKAADDISVDMARMLVGRLRSVSKAYSGAQAVADLKRELKEFNMQTKRWKE